MKAAEGRAQDVSNSGIYFVAPNQVCIDRILELEIVLPDEITHRGEVSFCFIAEPVREEQLNGAFGIHVPARGVGARLTVREDLPEEEVSPPKAQTG